MTPSSFSAPPASSGAARERPRLVAGGPATEGRPGHGLTRTMPVPVKSLVLRVVKVASGAAQTAAHHVVWRSAGDRSDTGNPASRKYDPCRTQSQAVRWAS